MVKQIRVSGFGGQGVILIAYTIGKAVTIYEEKYSSMVQAFGPEARGSSCNAQLIISDEKILYPYVTESDILIAMSQDAFNKFHDELKPEGFLLYEKELVDIKDYKGYGIPATTLSEKNLGKSIYANIIMFGFFAKVTGLIQKPNAFKAVKTSVPEHTIENNLIAFELGYEYQN